MTEKLKPCKCGIVPKVRKRAVQQIMDYIRYKKQYKFYVECPGCGYWYDVSSNTKAEAIAKWNRRAE